MKKIIARQSTEYGGVEMLNAGVSGWISDQVALRAEHQVAKYHPDIAVLYCGWNDFQGYDPLAAPPQSACFTDTYNARQYQALKVTEKLKSVALIAALVQKLKGDRVSPGVQQQAAIASQKTTSEDTYRFFLASLDRMIAGLKRENPNIKIVLCTLVGRWPTETVAVNKKNGCTWWIKLHDLSKEECALHLARLNQVIRDYGKRKGVLVADTALAFAPIDRSLLQHDFCHFSPEGYELLAEEIYESMRKAGYVSGTPSQRRIELARKFSASATPVCQSAPQWH